MYELSLNVLDIAQNSIAANATLIEISIEENSEKDRIEIVITDNGCGMNSEMLRSSADPFFTARRTRKVGLGIPLLKMDAELTGGTVNIESELGKGTKVYASFGLSHIDRAPIGDIMGTISSLVYCNPGIDFVYSHFADGKGYIMDTRSVRKVLGEDISLNAPEVTEFIISYLKENENDIHGGAN